MKLRLRLVTPVILWTVIFMMWAQVSISGIAEAQSQVRGGFASGRTQIGGAGGCQADVYGVTMPEFVIADEGDTVYYEFYVIYNDLRSSGAQATHKFTIYINYPGRLPNAKQWTYYTSGFRWQTEPIVLSHGVANVDPPVLVSVGWYASISCTECDPNPVSDSGGGSHWYIEPP